MDKIDDGDTTLELTPALCYSNKLVGLVIKLDDYGQDTQSSCGLDREEVTQLVEELQRLLAL